MTRSAGTAPTHTTSTPSIPEAEGRVTRLATRFAVWAQLHPWRAIAWMLAVVFVIPDLLPLALQLSGADWSSQSPAEVVATALYSLVMAVWHTSATVALYLTAVLASRAIGVAGHARAWLLAMLLLPTVEWLRSAVVAELTWDSNVMGAPVREFWDPIQIVTYAPYWGAHLVALLGLLALIPRPARVGRCLVALAVVATAIAVSGLIDLWLSPSPTTGHSPFRWMAAALPFFLLAALGVRLAAPRLPTLLVLCGAATAASVVWTAVPVLTGETLRTVWIILSSVSHLGSALGIVLALPLLRAADRVTAIPLDHPVNDWRWL